MRAVSILALSAAAFGALAMSGAQAQVIQRSVSEEPVETIVTQTPEGTVVTRRPLAGAAQESVDAITTREVVRRVETRPSRVTTIRKTDGRRTVKVVRERPAERVVTRTVRAPVPVIALSPAERRIVYQTIVQREVVPAAPRVIAPASPAYRETWRNDAWREPYREPYGAPVMAADEDVDVSAPVYTVGAVLPANVPLFAVPQDVGYRVPAAQPYSYAYVGGRAYLVDPNSGVIVADVTE
jgi:hypothetical protein